MGFLVKGGEGDIVVDDLPFFLFKKLKISYFFFILKFWAL
jgi:hypothetical protein